MEQVTMNKIDQDLLHNAPFGLLLCDQDGGIEWVNAALASQLGMTPDDLSGGRIQDLNDAAKRLLSTEPQLHFDAVNRRWLNRLMQCGDDGRCLYVISDVTEQEQLAEENARLRQQVEDLKLTDELTGMPNKRAISQTLDLHISRSRRYQNPLSVVLVHIDVHALTSVQPLSSDPVILAVSRFLRDRLRWVDQIARWEDNIFLLVLPETEEADARGLLEKVETEQQSIELPESYGELLPQLSFGLACWKKGDDMRTLLRSAVRALQQNSAA
jgi:diguanylate cyclase (GGDEF)-like protein